MFVIFRNMKTHNLMKIQLSALPPYVCGAMLALLALGSPDLAAGSGNESPQVPSETQILAAIKAQTMSEARGIGVASVASLLDQELMQRDEIIKELLTIFNDPKSADSVRAFAAYRLGVLRAAEAAVSLAGRITFKLIVAGSLHVQESPWWNDPAASALIAIGVPAIPAVIQNLAESNDEAIRSKSRQVLIGIEGGDKDITALRLQKALNAEKNVPKRERLQKALEELAK
jgi:hypothetical protein